MKEVSIVNRTLVINDNHDDFEMVDLIIDGETIDTGQNPVESYAFWEDMEGEVQRALYRIKTGNPKMGFDYNLSTMGKSDEEKRAGLTNHVIGEFPDVKVNELFDIIDTELKEIQHTGPDDNHPNPYLKMEISSDFVKYFIASIIDKYEKNSQPTNKEI